MDIRRSKFLHKLPRLLRHLPLLLMLGTIVFLLLSGKRMSVEALLSYSPKEPLLAACFLLLAFAVKSLSVMFPVMALFVAGGMLFPPVPALIVNTLGIAVTLTVPYWIGYLSGREMAEKLAAKYPKIQELRRFRRRNYFFFSYIVRAIGILPCDVLSLYMGSVSMPYLPYLAGGVLGFMPGLVCATVVGVKITDTSSPWFWAAIGIELLISAASMIVYAVYCRRTKEKKEERA